MTSVMHQQLYVESHPQYLEVAAFWEPAVQDVEGLLGSGLVWSRHRQAMTDPGSLEVVARAGDGVIEAIASTQRPMYLGVQWHPERTDDRQMGMGLFHRLVDQARGGNG